MKLPAVLSVVVCAIALDRFTNSQSLELEDETEVGSSTLANGTGIEVALEWLEEMMDDSSRAVLNATLSAERAALDSQSYQVSSAASELDVKAAKKENWGNWGANIFNTRSPANETKIFPYNAASLVVKKGWPARVFGDVSATPTVVNGTVYVVDWGFPNYLVDPTRVAPYFNGDGHLTAIHAETGKIKWTREVRNYTGVEGMSRTSPAIQDDILVIGTLHSGIVKSRRLPNSTFIVAVNATTGDFLWKTMVEAHPLATITASPTIYDGSVYIGVSSLEESLQEPLCCSFKGSIQKLDLYTGEVLWKFTTVPENYYGVAVWGSSPSIDIQRNQVYVATGNNYLVPKEVSECFEKNKGNYTKQAECSPPDNYYDSVLALDLDTGKLRWARRLAEADVYTTACHPTPPAYTYSNCTSYVGPDFDFGQAPMLILGKHGRPDLLAIAQKSGMVWGISPDNGTVVWGTAAGGGNSFGGSLFGSATDGKAIYVSNNNFNQTTELINPPVGLTSTTHQGGLLSALDLDGNILWQTPNPYPFFLGSVTGGPLLGPANEGPVSVANDVVYWPSMDVFGNLLLIDARTGQMLGSIATGLPIGSLGGGAAIVDGTVYVGSGYAQSGFPSLTWPVWAYTLPR